LASRAGRMARDDYPCGKASGRAGAIPTRRDASCRRWGAPYPPRPASLLHPRFVPVVHLERFFLPPPQLKPAVTRPAPLFRASHRPRATGFRWVYSTAPSQLRHTRCCARAAAVTRKSQEVDMPARRRGAYACGGVLGGSRPHVAPRVARRSAQPRVRGARATPTRAWPWHAKNGVAPPSTGDAARQFVDSYMLRRRIRQRPDLALIPTPATRPRFRLLRVVNMSARSP